MRNSIRFCISTFSCFLLVILFVVTPCSCRNDKTSSQLNENSNAQKIDFDNIQVLKGEVVKYVPYVVQSDFVDSKAVHGIKIKIISPQILKGHIIRIDDDNLLTNDHPLRSPGTRVSFGVSRKYLSLIKSGVLGRGYLLNSEIKIETEKVRNSSSNGLL